MIGMPDKKRRGGLLTRIPLLVTAAAVGTALVTELRTPEQHRTWHGEVWGFVPYDFRPPTPARSRATWWAPDGAILVPQMFGVGWTVNIGALVALLRGRHRPPTTA